MTELIAADAPRRFWERPEQYLLDAGRDGELVIARVRVALTAVLMLVPVADEYYGRFTSSEMISRVTLLATATALNVFIVRGIERQRKMSTADALTGVYNRRFLDDYLRNELARSVRHKSALAVAMIDVDHFKQFNDTHGHGAGDRALRQVAQMLLPAVRRTDLVARYGREEFIVVLPESSAAQAMDKLNAIREAIAADPLVFAWSEEKREVAKLTVSIGVSTWREEIAENAVALVAEADARLYEAKHAGQNRVVGPTA